MKAMLLFQQLTLVAFLVAISSIIVCPAAGYVSLDIIEYTIDYDQVTYVPDMVSTTYSDYYADKLRYLLGTADGKVSDYAVYGGKAWPLTNAKYNKDIPTVIVDKGYSSDPITLHRSGGCMAYASYCTVIFEKITININNNVSAKEINEISTASGLKKTIEENAQVGEHLRFQGDHDHSIIYIIEDWEKKGPIILI